MVVNAKTLCHSYRCLGWRLGVLTYMLNVGSEVREKEGDCPTKVDHRPAPWPAVTLLSTMTDIIPLHSKISALPDTGSYRRKARS